MLNNADQALRQSDLNSGWSFLLEAERIEIAALTDPQRDARAVALRTEVADKLREWRRNAALELLGDGAAGRRASVDEVKEAIRIRNESSHNQYHKLDLTREQLKLLGWVLLAVLVGLVLVARFGVFPIGKLDWIHLVTLMILGALGGSLSGVRSLAGRRDRKIPDQLSDWPITALRPLLGAAAATGVTLMVQAGIVSFGDPQRQDNVLLAVAFLAGFSERWFLGVIGGVSSGGKDS